MSIAEFYINEGLDPSDPNHMDDFLARLRDDSDDEYHQHSVKVTGLVIVKNDEKEKEFCSVAIDNSSVGKFVLDEKRLDNLANSNGFSKIDTASSVVPMSSYRKGASRLNFWLTTGTVGSYLEHPRQGKTQLFRRNVGLAEAEAIFHNPRIHTGKGYKFSRKGEGGRGPCRYGKNCYRADCWFDH